MLLWGPEEIVGLLKAARGRSAEVERDTDGTLRIRAELDESSLNGIPSARPCKGCEGLASFWVSMQGAKLDRLSVEVRIPTRASSPDKMVVTAHIHFMDYGVPLQPIELHPYP